MGEAIATPEGKPLDVDPAAADQVEKTFAQAMADPDAGNKQAPPRRTAKPKDTAGAEKPRVRKTAPKPAQATGKPQAAKPSGLSHEVRVQGVKGLVQLGAAGCLLAERGTKDAAYKADAITLASSADELGEAIAATADADERFARVVDKVCAAGPYSALIGVVFTVGSQVARNHGAQVPGTTPPDELIRMAEAQAA